MSQNQDRKYYVAGMHCKSCEILIEKKIKDLPGIASAHASLGKSQVFIKTEGDSPTLEKLNELFQKENYRFSLEPTPKETKMAPEDILASVIIALLIIAAFFGLNFFGFSGLVNVSASSSLIAFVLMGLLAGFSTCAALVGGIVLSMSKQWAQLHQTKDSFWQKAKPHLYFNFGRLLAYTVLGGLLGAIGQKIGFSPTVGAFLVIIVSGLMLILALQMLGVKKLKNFSIGLPKSITHHTANEKNFQGKYMPAILGGLTFFLPCGFTITAQGAALISGSAVGGALMMLAFALGTLPALLLIGLSSVEFLQKPKLAAGFAKTAGLIILVFALFNINAQLNVLGIKNLNDLSLQKEKVAGENVSGQQVIKMTASARGYSPNYFKVKVGVPVRWEITDTGTSGCTKNLIANNFFSGQIELTPGETAIKEFTPTKTGKFRFSCWMGMVSGIIEVTN